MPFHRGPALLRATLLGCLLLVLPPQAIPQQPAGQPTLDQVLRRLENNFNVYLHSIPSLFADEHVVSSMSINARPTLNSTTDSIFRLRPSVEGKLVDLQESRQVRLVDHQPATPDQVLAGPTILRNAFSSAPGFLLPQLKPCYDYQLHPGKRLHRNLAHILDYSLKFPLPPGAVCPVTEPHQGRAYLDPASLQIVRFEQLRRSHEIAPRTIGSWEWFIDYQPVTLNGKTFWLPKTIISRSWGDVDPSQQADAGSGTSNSRGSSPRSSGRQVQRQDWSFVATYRNYHLLTVTSKIVPTVEAESQH